MVWIGGRVTNGGNAVKRWCRYRRIVHLICTTNWIYGNWEFGCNLPKFEDIVDAILQVELSLSSAFGKSRQPRDYQPTCGFRA